MKILVRLMCIIVLLTFLFTCFQGQQSTAANDRQYVADISQPPAVTDNTNKLEGSLVLYAGSPMAIIYNVKKPIDPANPKVRPFSQDAVVFAPVRFIAESLGGKVIWDQRTKTAAIVIDSKTIKLSPGSKIMYVNTAAVNLDFPVIGDNGRILVPVNQLAEAMGKHVFFDRGLIIIGKAGNLFDKTADKALIDNIIADISQPPSVETAEGLKKLLGKIRESLLDSSFGNSYFYRADKIKSNAKTAEATVSGASQAAVAQDSFSGAADYSGTNVQVQGVDEADVVKTDGKYIYQVNRGKVVITEAYPASGLKVSGTISFTDGNFSPVELYIENEILTVIGQSSANIPIYNSGSEDLKVKYPDYSFGTVRAILYNCKDKNNIIKLRELELEGNYLSSRKIGSKLYLLANKDIRNYILNREAAGVYFDGDTAGIEAMGYDKKVVSGALEKLVRPLYRDTSVNSDYKDIDYTDIYYFPDSMELSYLTIASLDLEKPGEKADITAYLGSGQNIYVAPDNMYVAFTDYDGYRTMSKGGFLPGGTADYNTIVYRFSLDNGIATYRNKGTVPGTILNQFSMDEYNDTFRIATTKGEVWGSGDQTSRNNVYILDVTMGISGRLENIAPGEKIYSVRFMGDRGYVVTFRTVDPLFVIDLSQATSPKVLGALKIPGYSDYLHPYDKNHIIGFGKDTVEIKGQAYYQGMKIALFDVSDVANPIQKFSVNIGDRGTDSELLRNHKALLFSYGKNLLSFPVSVYEVNKSGSGGNESDKLQYGQFAFQGAYVYNIDLTKGFVLKGRITHITSDEYLKAGDHWYNSNNNIERILYIGDTLYTLSKGMIKASAISDLKETGSLQLP